MSGESSEFMSALKKNLASSKETINQLKRGSQKVVSAVNGNELSGAAYTAGKGLFSELIIPTITRTTNAIEKIEQELQRYKVSDQIVAMEGYLDENKLNQQLATTRVMKASVDTTSAFVQSKAQSNPFVGILETLLNVQRYLERMSESFQQDIDQLQNKLKKLHNFNSQTSGLFSHSLDELKLAMQGVLVLKNTRVRTDGSYLLPEGINKKWFTEVGTDNKVKQILEKLTEKIDYAHSIGNTTLSVIKEYGKATKVKAIRLGSKSVSSYSFSRTTRYAKTLESVSDDLLDSVEIVRSNNMWKGIGIAGTIAGIAFDYDTQMSKYNDIERATRNTVAYTIIDASGKVMGAYIGGILGTLIPIPGAGSVLGAVIGAGIGSFGEHVYDWIETGKAKKAFDNIGKTISLGINSLKNDVGKVFAGFGQSLGSIFG